MIQLAAESFVPCGDCGVGAGEICVTASGRPAPPHAARFYLVRRIIDATGVHAERDELRRELRELRRAVEGVPWVDSDWLLARLDEIAKWQT